MLMYQFLTIARLKNNISTKVWVKFDNACGLYLCDRECYYLTSTIENLKKSSNFTITLNITLSCVDLIYKA